MIDIWQSVPTGLQDAILLFFLLLPGLFLGYWVIRGYRPWQLVSALLVRYRWLNLLFVLLIAISVGVGTAILAQEKALRAGSARAAEKFDLVVSAPGSKIDMLMAVVYLQPVDVPLLDGKVLKALAEDPRVDLAAPIAYGDSYHGFPVIGSTADFVHYLAGKLVKGSMFSTAHEVVIGAKVDLSIGDTFIPVHGHGQEADLDEQHEHGDEIDSDEHHEITADADETGKSCRLAGTHHHHHHDHNYRYKVVGRMERSGTPWDKAIITPVEALWAVHGLTSGHLPHDERLGPPFDYTHFPGTPAIIVHAKKLWANYALASEYTTDKTMAFFPGTVLAKLHGLLGDVRKIMSLLSNLTEVLVALSIFSALIILARLFSRRFALLRAIGAPGRFIFAVMWSYTAILVSSGSLAGLVLGYLGSRVFAIVVARETDITLRVFFSWNEYQHVAAFFSLALLLAVFPAYIAFRKAGVADLRAG